MEIQVNGKKKRCDGSVTVGVLVESLGLRPGWVVVEKNLRVVPRDRMAEETLQDGDTLEVIRLVGGG